MKIDNSIYHQPAFLMVLTCFILFMGHIYHLGVVGVIVFVRTLFVFKNNIKYKKNFSFKEDKDYLYIQFGLKDLFKLKIDKKDIDKIETIKRGLFRKSVSIVSMKNGGSFPIEYVQST